MRKGLNPHKDKVHEPIGFFHQVVVPVYIPNQEEYFKDSFTILKYCLSSLFKTSHNKTYFTIVNNGSCIEVKEYLDNLFNTNQIHEIVNTSNIGYINAMLKGIVGHNFKFLTTTDSDVLFLNGWQKESYMIFNSFPKAGAVSPSPNSKMLKSLTNNVLCENIFSKKVKFSNVKNPSAMLEFAKSINYINLFNEVNLKKYLTINNGKSIAVIGASHFAVTYRSDIFDSLEKKSTKFILGGDSDLLFDYPVVKKGYWRLSTEDNFAYHMGNTIEDWMLDIFEDLIENDNNKVKSNICLSEIKTNPLLNWLNLKVFSKILFKNPFWKLFLRYKGLSRIEADNY